MLSCLAVVGKAQTLVPPILAVPQTVVHQTTLTWQPSTSTVVGYKPYRSTTNGGPYTLLTTSPVASSPYVDKTVVSGATYYYVVTSIDSSSLESVFSNQVTAIIPADPIAITTTSLPAGTVGSSYPTNIQLACNRISCVWTGTVAPGLALSSSGIITGVPTIAGPFTASVTATDSTGSTSASITITINPQPAITITTTSLPAGTVGVNYPNTQMLCNRTSCAWTGTLPAGLAVSASGLITGNPTASGAFTATFNASDTTGAATTSLPISINPAPPLSNSFWTSTDTPANKTGNDSSSVELGLKFSSSVPGSITAIKYYKATNSTSAHTGTLWSSTGAKLATVTFTGETASGWQIANLATPVNVTAGTTYVVSYHTSQYVWTDNYFATAKAVNPLSAPVNAGVYIYGTASAFPTSTWQGDNYWVDIVFQPGNVPPPVGITVTPTAISLLTNTTQQFTANVTNVTNTAVTWSATCGTISNTGLYTAPGVAGPCTVKVTSQADTTKSASATVTVTAPPAITITIAPTTVTMLVNGTQQFTNTVGNTTNTAVTWSTSSGVISSSGAYTAPAAAGKYTVTVTSIADPTKSASATVTVNLPPATLSQPVCQAQNGTLTCTSTYTNMPAGTSAIVNESAAGIAVSATVPLQ